MMYRGSGCSPSIWEQPSRRPSGPGSRVRLHRLERRRRRGIGRPAVPRRLARRRRASRASTPRTSSTSRRRARRSSFGDGGIREVDWPEVEIFEARIPRAPRDLVIVTGAEPSMRWRTFSRLIIDLSEALGAQLRRHARRPAGRRAALAPGAAHGLRLRRRARRALRPGSRRPTRARRASSACCTPPARTRASRRRRCGPACRTTSPPRRTRRPRSRSCASSSRSSASRRRRASSRPPPPTTSARCRSRCRATPTCRRSSSASSRRAEEEEPDIGPADLPSGDVIARDFQRFLRQRGPETGGK